jgi:DNA-binding transcriptional LysR family regulator
MTIIEIETFLEIIRQGTITGAANTLYISQPTITRRIQHMEEELGYSLFIRNKGKRKVELTDEGTAFLRIAGKWQMLLQETAAISETASRQSLSVASVYSVSKGLLSRVLPDFANSGYHLRLYNAFSEDAYQYMERGIFDLAFIGLQDYYFQLPAGVQQIPAFTEDYMIASSEPLADNDTPIDIRDLDRELELYVPWDIPFVQWHVGKREGTAAPRIVLEDLTLIDTFLSDGRWIIGPYSLGLYLQSKGAFLYDIQSPPPKRLTYYLTRGEEKSDAIQYLLSLINDALSSMPGNKIHSLL